MICNLHSYTQEILAIFAALLKIVKFEATRNCFGIRYNKCKFNAVIIIGCVSFIKVKYLSIIKQFGFEIAKELMDNILIICH